MKNLFKLAFIIFLCLTILNINAFAKESDKKIDPEVRKENIKKFIDKSGDTIESRFLPPDDYYREEVPSNSFANYIREIKLYKYNRKVKLYNGKNKKKQKYHISVTTLPMLEGDLQQCADSVMRLYSDFMYKIGAKDKISFHFVKGFKSDFKKWMSGNIIKFRDYKNERAYWAKDSRNKDNLKSYLKYLRYVFAYASTMSMYKETKKIKPNDIEIGDVFLRPGSPGHVCMVVDTVVNDNGDKYFMLGEGSTPAQNFVIIDNPKTPGNPWYHINSGQKILKTMTSKFNISKTLRRPKYLDKVKLKPVFDKHNTDDEEDIENNKNKENINNKQDDKQDNKQENNKQENSKQENDKQENNNQNNENIDNSEDTINQENTIPNDENSYDNQSNSEIINSEN